MAPTARLTNCLPRKKILYWRSCDDHLLRVLEILEPQWLIGVGDFAAKRGKDIIEKMKNPPLIGQILHPSPASPAANRGWAQKANGTIDCVGVWKG